MGCHFLLPGNLPDPGIKPRSPALQADSLPSEPPGKQGGDELGIFPLPGDFPDLGIKPAPLASPTLAAAEKVKGWVKIGLTKGIGNQQC